MLNLCCVYLGCGPLPGFQWQMKVYRDSLLKMVHVILVVTGILWGGHTQCIPYPCMFLGISPARLVYCFQVVLRVTPNSNFKHLFVWRLLQHQVPRVTWANQMDVNPKTGGFQPPKMDGENKGSKPLLLKWMIWGFSQPNVVIFKLKVWFFGSSPIEKTRFKVLVFIKLNFIISIYLCLGYNFLFGLAWFLFWLVLGLFCLAGCAVFFCGKDVFMDPAIASLVIYNPWN